MTWIPYINISLKSTMISFKQFRQSSPNQWLHGIGYITKSTSQDDDMDKSKLDDWARLNIAMSSGMQHFS